MIKKISAIVCMTLMVIAFNPNTVFAKVGSMGFNGGITQGVRLPKTTESFVKTTVKGTAGTPVVYKEMIMISGTPVVFEGLMTLKTTGDVDYTLPSGTYSVTYDTRASATTDAENQVVRTMKYTVNWYKQGNQVVRDFTVSSWVETLTVGGIIYKIDQDQSHYDISILEDVAAGVSYYSGNISQKSVYTTESASTVVEMIGSIYGYYCPWSNTETHRLDYQVSNDQWQMKYQIRPSVSVNKTLQYSKNEPTAISFAGNYQEVMQNKSGLQYDITVLPKQLYGVATKGTATIDSYNAFEQLMAPDTSHLKGNFAEADISKLYSIGVLSGDTKLYVPSQTITRGEFVTMLVKAIKVSPVAVPVAAKATAKKPAAINIVFPDVLQDRADYGYIMAAYNAGLAVGRGTGHFQADYPIEREEAFVIMLRTLDLSNLGLEPTPITPYVDDAKISYWAKKDIYAATRIGLISGDDSGNINPKAYVSKAEAAAIVNKLIEYMRTGLQLDYTENIVNYQN